MNWNKTETGIKAKLTFENQETLAEFVLKLANISDVMQHHADMDIRYNQLYLNIFTHDEQAITEKDETLCHEIEKLFE